MQTVPNITELRKVVSESELAQIVFKHLCEEGRRNRQFRSLYSLKRELEDKGVATSINDLAIMFNKVSKLGLGEVKGRGGKTTRFIPGYALKQIAKVGLGYATSLDKFKPRVEFKDIPREFMSETTSSSLVIKRGDVEIRLPANSDVKLLVELMRNL